MSRSHANNESWGNILRLLAVLAAAGAMFISAQFSVDGFKITVTDRAWIGWAMAAILVVTQSIWQKFGSNLTLFVVAMTAYVYGIYTNVLGIMAGRGYASFDGIPTAEWVIPVVFGFFLEVFPEPVFAWAFSGDISSDPLGNTFKKIGALFGSPARPVQSNYSQKQNHNTGRPQYSGGNAGQRHGNHSRPQNRPSNSGVPDYLRNRPAANYHPIGLGDNNRGGDSEN